MQLSGDFWLPTSLNRREKMELAPLFAEQRWNILKHISERPRSPMQLAELTKTTMANISQQLRLLEAAGLVTKKKIPNSKKGQPRALFSLPQDYAYIVSVTGNYAEKKLVRLSRQQKIYLRILSLDNPAQSERLEAAFLEARPHLGKISMVAADLSGEEAVMLLAAKDLPKKLAASIRVVAEEKLNAMAKEEGSRILIFG